MISRKIASLRNLQLLRNTHYFSSSTEHHQPKTDVHHEAETIDPSIVKNEQTRYAKIFVKENHEHFPISAYNFLGQLTKNKTIFSFFFQNLSAARLQEVSEYWNPPKIHENSVFVYQSKPLGNTVRFARGAEYLFVTYGLLLSPHPVYLLAIGSLAYYFWLNAFFYEMSRRLVVRMDLLPHLEMVNMQKVGAFGQIYNKLVRVQDLEKVPFEELFAKEDYKRELFLANESDYS